MRRSTNPETREREAVGKVSSIFSDAGRYSWSFRAPATGRYHVKLAGYTIWVGGGGIGRWFYEGQGAEKAPVYHLPLWHRPDLDEVWPGRNNEPIGVYASGNGQTRPVAARAISPRSPRVCDVDVTLVAGEGLQTDAMRLFRTRVNGTDEQYVNPLATEDGIPGYAVQWIEVEGPFYDDSYDAADTGSSSAICRSAGWTAKGPGRVARRRAGHRRRCGRPRRVRRTRRRRRAGSRTGAGWRGPAAQAPHDNRRSRFSESRGRRPPPP